MKGLFIVMIFAACLQQEQLSFKSGNTKSGNQGPAFFPGDHSL